MRFLAWLILLALIATLAPNLVWLWTSTVRIHNASGQAIDSVAYSACETVHQIGTLAAGGSAFRLLEACGDDSLQLLLGDSRYCQIYVEGELYHVDFDILAPESVECSYDSLLSSLFISKAIW